MKNILVICPSIRDKRELKNLQFPEYRIIFDPHEENDLMPVNFGGTTITHIPKDIARTLDIIKKRYAHESIDGIICSDDYPGTLIASLLARSWGLPAPSTSSILWCQHKYYSRLAQQRSVWYATPQFTLVDPKAPPHELYQFELPFFIKPIKSQHSINACKITSYEQLHKELPHLALPQAYVGPFEELVKKYTSWNLPHAQLIAESLLRGKQCTLDGFVQNGHIQAWGIVDSIMYPDTMSFERFEYPSSLSENVQLRMATIAATFMRFIGFNHGFFNIEFMYNPELDTIGIIEVNPRMCGQFADLYQKVKGINTYDALLKLITQQPINAQDGNGKFPMAASCVLRTFQDHFVQSIPSPEDIANVTKRFPGTRVEIKAEVDRCLSDLRQDGKSYLYAVLNIGGKNREDIMKKLEACKKLLPFTFT